MSSPVIWKHIGLHGHSVGTFVCEDARIVWKSAMMGGNKQQENVGDESQRVIAKDKLLGAQWTVLGRSGHVRIQSTVVTNKDNTTTTNNNDRRELRFDGFPPKDHDLLAQTLEEKYGVTLKLHHMSSAGTQYGLTSVAPNKNLTFQHCVLDEMNEEGQEFESRAGDEMMSLDLAEISQCVLPGNNRNEIEVQFPESDTVEAGTDQLVAIRFYIPPSQDADPADKAAPTAAENLQSQIMSTANIRKTTGDVIVQFEQNKGTFLTPRGRYSIELYDFFLRLRGQKYDYKIKYDDINRLFLLPKPGGQYMCFVIALDKPIRQGQQRYQYLVLQASKDPDEVTVNLDEETLQKEYDGELQPVMRGALSNLVAKTFKIITKKKVFIPGKFANANQEACVKCAVRANEGLLYPLEKQFVFIHKPAILVRFNEVESVEFQRYAGGQGSTRNFDLCVNLKQSVVGMTGATREYVFSGIDRTDYTGLYNFLHGKKIPIKNIEGVGGPLEESVGRGASAPVYNEDEIYGGPDDDDDEGSDDEDYDEKAMAAEEAARAAGSDDDSDADSDDDVDEDDFGSEIDSDLDSDLEDARKERTKKTKKKKSGGESPKKKKRKKAQDSDDDSDEGGKKKKKKKDPNAPKRPTSAYFYFMAEQREQVKEENPGASVSEVAKIVGAKWREISSEEKAKFEAMNAKDKKRYEKEMEDYVPPDDVGSPGKGKKKAKKDPNEPKRGMTSFMFFSKEARPKIKEEFPDISFGDTGKKLGEMYKKLTPEEKQKYEKMANDDKLRYKKDMEEYNKNKKSSKQDDGDDDDDDDSDSDDDDSSDDDSDSD